MADEDLEFHNILVIDFGQLGDVILSLPVLTAVRTRFPSARITLLIGQPGADIVRVANVSDDQIVVDRVALRDSNKFWSIHQLYKLVRQIRARKFDLIIDLNSFYETNIIGYLSGARSRLYAVREGRSLDRLAKFPVSPPPEDKSKHLTNRYFDVVGPLGITPTASEIKISPPESNITDASLIFERSGINAANSVGLFVGAGHPSRCWSLEKFAELARRLITKDGRDVLVFLGPEESRLADPIRSLFPDSAVLVEGLDLLTCMAAVSMLSVFITNDTGPMHLAALGGTPIVLLLDMRAPDTFLPFTEKLRVLNGHILDDLDIDEVFEATLATINN